jgi:hypothetical protein
MLVFCLLLRTVDDGLTGQPVCRLTTEALEKGATAEADFLQQVKVYLPESIAASIKTPETPVSKAKAQATPQGTPVGVVTELPDDLELN